MKSLFVTDGTDYFFGGFPCIVVDAYNAGVFVAAEDRGLYPADIIGNPSL